MPDTLIPATLRAQLPLLGAWQNEVEPMVYARYFVPDGAWQFCVTEGEPAGTDYVLFGLLMSSEDEREVCWRKMR